MRFVRAVVQDSRQAPRSMEKTPADAGAISIAHGRVSAGLGQLM
ncbi:hypothetical protein [Pelotomaculum sp. FP]|nr:hypothetical protein [Pelotomaculum sp. FP]